MPDRDAINRGREFEQEAVETLGLSLVPGSGNQWTSRSDGQGRIRLSCKANPVQKRSWAQTRAQLREALDLAQGTGEIPALAIEDRDGEQLLILRLADAGALLSDESRVERKPRRAEVVRGSSQVPVLLRDE